MFFGTVLCGLSFGMHLSLRSVQIGEYTSPKNRGAFLATMNLAQGFGILFSHLLGSLLPWKTTAMICLVFPIISFFAIIYLPESPIWLASIGRFDDCRKAFKWLRGQDENKELEVMIRANTILVKENTARSENKNILRGITKTIKKKEFYKPILIMVLCMGLINFTGVTIMVSYTTVILELIFGPEANVVFWMIYLDSLRMVSSTLAVYMINKLKRRTVMFGSGGISVFCLLAIAVYMMAIEGAQSRSIWIPALLLNIQIFSNTTGMLPLPNVLAGEVYPLKYKGIGGLVSSTFGSIYLFTILKSFLPLIDDIGLAYAYMIYAAILTSILVALWFLTPETKGKTLQEIEDEFRGRRLDPEEESKKPLQEKPDLGVL